MTPFCVGKKGRDNNHLTFASFPVQGALSEKHDLDSRSCLTTITTLARVAVKFNLHNRQGPR